MEQTEIGKARMLLITDALTEVGGKLFDETTSSHYGTQRWKVGLRTVFIELYPNGYNLFISPSGDNDVDADLEAIKSLAT